MVESRKRREREVRLDYAFDRLLAAKLQQVYEILVSDRVTRYSQLHCVEWRNK